MSGAYLDGDSGYLWLTCSECEESLMHVAAGTDLTDMNDALKGHLRKKRLAEMRKKSGGWPVWNGGISLTSN
ncbi:hypothetical protein ACWDTT_36335 [Streptosporangium sandarakinum]